MSGSVQRPPDETQLCPGCAKGDHIVLAEVPGHCGCAFCDCEAPTTGSADAKPQRQEDVKMSARSGTARRRRSAQVSVRLTPVEATLMRKIAAHDGVSPGEVFRRAVFDTPCPGSPTGTPAQERTR